MSSSSSSSSNNAPPNLAALASALKEFVDAPTWDESFRILDARRDLLLTVDAPLALVRRLGHATSANRRGLLSTSARLLIIARDSGIDAARAWLDTRRRAQEAFTAIVESLENVPEAQAQAIVQQRINALPSPERRYIEEMLLEAAEAAADQQRQGEDDEEDSGSGGGGGGGDEQLEQALQALISAEDDSTIFATIERYQVILTDGRAAATLRAYAARLHQDPQPGAAAFAQHLDRLAELVERVARQGLAGARATTPGGATGAGAGATGNQPINTPMLNRLGSLPGTATQTTVIDPQRVRVPTDRDRALVNILVQSGKLSEPIRRGLQAWIGTPGITATREEIAVAYGLFRETTRQ